MHSMAIALYATRRLARFLTVCDDTQAPRSTDNSIELKSVNHGTRTPVSFLP